jgi:molecular chaperone GrpE
LSRKKEQEQNESEILAGGEELEEASTQESKGDSPQLKEVADSEVVEELTLEQQIEQLQIQLSQAGEDVLRAKAQEQNTLRRASLDVEKARKFALESFVKELLPVVDNLERALASAIPDQPSAEAFVEGVELTLKSFLTALEKSRVQAIDPAGEPFNPEQHQAMASIENNEVEPNTVIEVFQKGYELNGRLIRPAMVVVSKSS